MARTQKKKVDPFQFPRPRKRKRKPPRNPNEGKIKYKFEETKVGYYLKYEAPLEYELIMKAYGSGKAPSAVLIEQIGYSSLNPLFKKPKFRKALIEYRKHGLYCGKPMKGDVKTELFYMRIRQRNSVVRGTAMGVEKC